MYLCSSSNNHPVEATTSSETTVSPQGQEHFIQVGVRLRGEYTNTAKIQLNGPIAAAGWHTLALVVDKDSSPAAKVYLDDKYVGSIQETLAPRDVGGVMTLNIYENRAEFEYFTIGHCLKFNSIGQCK